MELDFVLAGHLHRIGGLEDLLHRGEAVAELPEGHEGGGRIGTEIAGQSGIEEPVGLVVLDVRRIQRDLGVVQDLATETDGTLPGTGCGPGLTRRGRSTGRLELDQIGPAAERDGEVTGEDSSVAATFSGDQVQEVLLDLIVLRDHLHAGDTADERESGLVATSRFVHRVLGCHQAGAGVQFAVTSDSLVDEAERGGLDCGRRGGELVKEEDHRAVAGFLDGTQRESVNRAIRLSDGVTTDVGGLALREDEGLDRHGELLSNHVHHRRLAHSGAAFDGDRLIGLHRSLHDFGGLSEAEYVEIHLFSLSVVLCHFMFLYR